MEILLILFVALGAAGLIFQGMMYTRQFSGNLGVRLANAGLGIIIAYITFTSYPDGEYMRKGIVAVLGICAIGGLTFSLFSKERITGKWLLTLSVLGGLGILYLDV